MKITLLLFAIIIASCTTTTPIHNDPIHNDPVHNDPTIYPIETPDAAIITAEGKGSSEKLAISNAWRQAMHQFVKNNVDISYYTANENKIETYIIENWRSYTIGDPETPEIQQRYLNRRITIRAHIKGELVYDIQRQIQ